MSSQETPVAARVDSLITWVQPLLTMALLVLTLVTISPKTWWSLGLVAVVAVLSFARTVPDRLLPCSRLVAVAALGLASGLLFVVDPDSFAVSFAYVATLHAGLRFATRPAVVLAAVVTAIAVCGLVLRHGQPGVWDWPFGLTVFLPVFSGMIRRNREQTLLLSAQLVEQTRRAAGAESEASALAERTRIARDLHDVLAHTLTGVGMRLDLADAQLESGVTGEARESLQHARSLVVEGMVEARRAVQALRTDALDVGAALRGVVQPGERLDCTDPMVDLPAPTAQVVVRVVQEALTNARRHAPGAAVEARVRRTDGAVVVEVRNAAAHGEPMPSGSGMGLVGLRERVTALGGTTRIGPVGDDPPWAWEVHAELPEGHRG